MDGLLEDKVTQAIGKFYKGRFSREPTSHKVIIQDDVIIVRVEGIISRSECELSRTDEGLKLIKEMYNRLFIESIPLLKSIMKDITGVSVKDVQSEVNPQNYECIQIFTFKENLKGE